MKPFSFVLALFFIATTAIASAVPGVRAEMLGSRSRVRRAILRITQISVRSS